MSIVLIPLDDRPCCTQFVQRVAAMAGREVTIPPESGCFLAPGDPEAMLGALRGPWEAAMVSLDMIAWGGLVASRSQNSPFEQAVERLERVAGLVRGRVACAYQSILRTAPTQTSPQEVLLAERLVELSVLTARKDPRAEELSRLFPAGYLSDYLDRRKRAHLLNRVAIRQAGQGTWSSLLLGVDDSRTEGWNVLEIDELSQDLPANVTIAPGTDEMALLQLVRLVGPIGPVEPRWFPAGAADRVGLFEDRSMAGVVEAQARAASIGLAPSPRQLWIYGPLAEQVEAAEQTQEDPARARAFCRQLEQAIERGARVAVADVAHANGGDLTLLEELLVTRLAPKLVAYSAWNTAGNTLGTALAALALWPDRPDPVQNQARLRFLAERLLDDGYYQASVRPALGTRALQNAGSSVESSVRQELELRLDRLIEAGFPPEPLQVSLPWNRVFEVRVELG